EERGHQQVIGGELELRCPHHLDVFHVLARELRHRDVEDVERVAANEVEEEVQRALERVEEDRERFRRDVEVLGHFRERLAADLRDGHRQVEHGLLVREGIVGGVRGHLRPAMISAAALLTDSGVGAPGGISTSSQANFTPMSLAALVAAMMKFSPRSTLVSPCFFTGAEASEASSSGSASFSP